MPDICGDKRFEIIAEYKKRLIEGTNIESCPEEMAVIDSILFRFWQMRWIPAADVEPKQRWIPVTERLPECEVGAEIGNVEWISHDMVFAGCFGRGGKYRDAYFRTWTDTTEGIDAKDADCWRVVTLPEPQKGGNKDEIQKKARGD